MPENKMKEVAQLLGVEIGEEFKVKGNNEHNKYKFTDTDLDVYRNNVSVRSLQYKVTIERNRIQYDALFGENIEIVEDMH